MNREQSQEPETLRRGDRVIVFLPGDGSAGTIGLVGRIVGVAKDIAKFNPKRPWLWVFRVRLARGQAEIEVSARDLLAIRRRSSISRCSPEGPPTITLDQPMLDDNEVASGVFRSTNGETVRFTFEKRDEPSPLFELRRTWGSNNSFAYNLSHRVARCERLDVAFVVRAIADILAGNDELAIRVTESQATQLSVRSNR